MDIMELSRKMEANLLETHSSLRKEPQDNFSPRITRSQINSTKNLPTTDSKAEFSVLPKRRHRKVDEMEEIYINKKPKVVHKNLETIYEDPIWKKGSTVLLGTSKVKRSIYLDREFRVTSKQKSKLRKMKIKRLGKRTKPFKMSDDEFRNRMSKIESYIDGNEVDIDRGCDVEFDDDRKVQSTSSTDKSYSDSKDSNEFSE